jgi:hypothetical protein
MPRANDAIALEISSTQPEQASLGRPRVAGKGWPHSYAALMRGVTFFFLIGTAVLVTGCGSSAEGASASSSPDKAQISATCTRVADVLSDGPDPTADPVGYALAQIMPLREIKTSVRALRQDIDAMASAYETVYKTNGEKGTEKAVEKAGKELDTICPGAF